MKRLLLFKTCGLLLMAMVAAGHVQASVTLNTANFPDENFREAVALAANTTVDSSFDETMLTSLDVSNQGISSLKGLELLTGLTYLDISGNSSLTTGADLSNLRALTTLKASNCNLISLQGVTGTSNVTNVSGAGLVINYNNSGITYLDISHNPNFYSSGNLRYLTMLETLVMHHCTNFDYWGAPGTYLESLKYVDVSYCTNMDRIYLPAAARLEVLKAAGLTKLKGFISRSSYSGSDQAQYYIALKNGLTTLQWLDVSGCSQLKNIYLRSCASLRHLNAAGTPLKGFSGNATLSNGMPTDDFIQLASNLATLEYLKLGNCTSLNSLRAINSTYGVSSLDTLILTNCTSLGWSNDGIETQTGLKYLDVTNCNISTAGPTYVPNFSHLTQLETLLYGENPAVGYLRITGNSALKTLDLHGDTGLTMLALDNCGLPRTNLDINGNNCPALTGLKLNNNGYASIGQATNDAAAWGLQGIKFLYLENNSGFTGGPLTLNASDCAGLTGLDLSNNRFTSFVAPSLPDNLTALMIGKNPNMTHLEMHYNPGITKMAADTVMSDGSGLYLLGNTALTYMDISGTAEQPNHFKLIGNNGSLYNVPIDTLKASYNKFYTFRNLTTVPGNNYEHCNITKNAATGLYEATYLVNTNENQGYTYKSYWPTMSAAPDSASLEQLTRLKYLDLSHCNLKDSVYLHKNTELTYLDVSHNRSIARYTTSQDKGRGLRQWIQSGKPSTSYPDYKKYLWLSRNADDIENFTHDYNDTTGLYILDLLDNNNLEYLDISYTGIEQTALTHCHVANARYIWIQDLPKLKYFYADYNGMRSLGIGTRYGKKRESGKTMTDGLKALERLSVIGMRGADDRTMMGSINFSETAVFSNLHYINLSYSRFDSIGVYMPQIDTLIIKGNPLHYVDMQKVNNITYLDARECAYKMRGYDVETGDIYYPNANRYKNGARENGSYYKTVDGVTVPTEEYTPLSGLRGVRAYGRHKLTTVLLDNCNALTEVYCFNDSVLPRIQGFDNLAFNQSYDAQHGFPTVDADSLTLVWVNDNKSFIDLDLSRNVNLKYLHAYNDKALGNALGSNGMDLKENTSLITAWVSNSNLQHFNNKAFNTLDTLKIWQNPELSSLDVTGNKELSYFDLRNCMIRSLDVSHNDKLTYFDCSNMDSISAQWTAFDNYGFEMPRNVPTSMYQPGKNSIADLNFASKRLVTVHADNNDLYCMTGLDGNTGLQTLTYAYNHINGIDLSGCPAISTYDCQHNVRGLIMGELAAWDVKLANGEVNHYKFYYLQLKENAGDALDGKDTFLGHKCGQDSLENATGQWPYMRNLEDDGFKPDKVISFTVNATGPYDGHRGDEQAPQGAPRRQDIIYGPDTVPNPDLIYGKTVVLRYYDNERNYCEYLYDDGRPASSTRNGGGSAFGLAWAPPGTPTTTEEILADGLTEPGVVSERYYDLNGVQHSEPVKGVNIVVKQMADGTTRTEKIIR